MARRPPPEPPEHYDPEMGPAAAEWLALSEEERHALAEAAHEDLPEGHPEAESWRTHAAVHVIVENQLAASDPPGVHDLLIALREAGWSRHTAIHAIGMAVTAVMTELLDGRETDAPARLARDYAKLAQLARTRGLDAVQAELDRD